MNENGAQKTVLIGDMYARVSRNPTHCFFSPHFFPSSRPAFSLSLSLILFSASAVLFPPPPFKLNH